MICSSVSPAASFSRISSRICAASSAGESATLSFWHTGQRKRAAIAAARASRSFAVAGPAARSNTVMTRMTQSLREARGPKPEARPLSLGRTGATPQQRLDLRGQLILGHGAGVFGNDASCLVNHERFRNAVDAVVYGDLPAGVHSVGKRLSESVEKFSGRLVLILDVHPHHGDSAAAVPLPNPLQVGRLLVAGWKAP